MLVKLMTPKITFDGKPIKSKPSYFLPAEVVGIRPSSGPFEGGSIIVTKSNSSGSLVRESPSLAHRKLFVDPVIKNREEVRAFIESVTQEPNDPPA